MGSVFKLKFPTVDDITECVQKLKGNCLLYKIDLQRAFRHLNLDPKDINYTGCMYLENRLYVSRKLLQQSLSGKDMDLSACKE